MEENSPRLSLFDLIALAGATWFGSGLLPLMPGTWGTLAAVPLVAAMSILLAPLHYVAAAAILTLIAIPMAARAASLYRSHARIRRLNPHARRIFDSEALQRWIKDEERQKEDPGMVVIDEVVGYAVAMIAVRPSLAAFVIAFVFFRVFDIIKIQPGRLVEKLGGGIGIVMDDVVAGLYACLLTHVSLWILSALPFPELPLWLLN